MYHISKRWLSCIVIFSIVLSFTPTTVNTMSRSGAKKTALALFGGCAVIWPLEIAFLQTSHGRNSFFSTIKSPELWIGSTLLAGISGGIAYAFLYYFAAESCLDRARSAYDLVSNCSVYVNRNDPDQEFFKAVMTHEKELIVQQLHHSKTRARTNPTYTVSNPSMLTLLTDVMLLGLVAFELFADIDDPRGDLALLYVTQDLVKKRKNVSDKCEDLKQLVNYLEDSELLDQSYDLINKLEPMILEIERCIARIVGTKQWVNLVSNAQIVINGTTGTKTIPNKFISSICESMGYFDAQYGHHSNVRKVREQEGMYIRFELDETLLQDWAAYIA